MTVLVTGSTGFTGGHLARYLSSLGRQVRALVRGTHRGGPLVRDLETAGIEIVYGDLRNASEVTNACDGVEVVYHIAATYREAGQPDSAYRDINVTGTRHVLDGARTAGVRRVVHCSTGGVHGHIVNPPATEDAPFAPGDIYQETKLEAEELVRQFGAERRPECVIVRPIGIYGPRDTRFLKMFRGIARRRFPVLGSGEVYYHLTYIDDLAEGFRLSGEVEGAAGRTYILGGPRYTTLNELVRLMADELGVEPLPWRFPVWPFWLAGAMCEALCVPLRIQPPLYRRRVDFYTKSRAFDCSRARKELGYAPRVDLREGIKRTADWYREQHLL